VVGLPITYMRAMEALGMADFNIDDFLGEDEDIVDGEDSFDIGSLFGDDHDEVDALDGDSDFSFTGLEGYPTVEFVRDTFEGSDAAFRKYQCSRPLLSRVFAPTPTLKK
jgi:hypothetical protein